MKAIAKILYVLMYLALGLNLAAFAVLPYIMAGQFGSGSREFWLALWVFYPCGCASALIIWSVRGILNNLVKNKPFSPDNSVHMLKMSFSCFAISALALTRGIIWLCWYGLGRDFWIFKTYNTFFIPSFFLAGLFCLVFSGLFRQAADLKEDNDLVI